MPDEPKPFEMTLSDGTVVRGATMEEAFNTLARMQLETDSFANGILSTVTYADLIETLKSDHRFTREILGKNTIEQMGNRLLAESIDGEGVSYAMWPKYWTELKNEFKKLICTSDRKYQSLRKDWAAAANKSHATIVSSIAAVMASQFGVAAGLLVPFCALILIAVLKLGKEAFCASTRLDIVIAELPQK